LHSNSFNENGDWHDFGQVASPNVLRAGNHTILSTMLLGLLISVAMTMKSPLLY
jgi:hypothetical protein